MTPSSSTSPTVRNPGPASRGQMTTRGWWLVVLNFLIPGSAQAVAGNRRFGKFGLFFTLVFWALIIVTVLLYLLNRTLAITIATSAAAPVIQGFLVFYAILWAVFTLDTLRLLKLVRTGEVARFLIVGLSLVLLLATAGVATRGAFVVGALRAGIKQVFADGPSVPPINGGYNVLLLGGDAGPDRVGLRPDSISVASINATTGETTMIGIPRNMQKVPFVKGSPLWGPYPHGYDCGVNCLVSFLYTYGEEHPNLYPNAKAEHSEPGIEATRDAVEGILGIKVPFYALIDMQGFSDLVNSLGGVTIVVKEKLPIGGGTDANGQPIGTHKWIYPGKQHMNGFVAQWYARSRHGTSDYDRMARQRQVESAMLAQFQPARVLDKFEAVLKAGKQVVKTNVPQPMLGTFLQLADLARKQKPKQLELVPPVVFEPAPDFVQIRSLVSKALVIKTSTTTPKP